MGSGKILSGCPVPVLVEFAVMFRIVLPVNELIPVAWTQPTALVVVENALTVIEPAVVPPIVLPETVAVTDEIKSVRMPYMMMPPLVVFVAVIDPMLLLVIAAFAEEKLKMPITSVWLLLGEE